MTVQVMESQFIMSHAVHKELRVSRWERRLLDYPPSHGRNKKSVCLARPTKPAFRIPVNFFHFLNHPVLLYKPPKFSSLLLQ